MSNEIKKSILAILKIVCEVFLIPAIIVWLFNAFVPGLFRIASLTYWQAFGLNLICKLLFK